MRRWLRRGDRFWADRAAALAYRAELQRGGRPTDPAGQAKQVVSGTHLPASIAASITAHQRHVGTAEVLDDVQPLGALYPHDSLW